ncbi:MAG: hypothetical protein GY772_00725, partial [bacterium]|nr:hypothetical protein [bacterium]
GEAVFTAQDLRDATEQVLFEANLPPVEGAAAPEPTQRREHELASGWYSEEVLAMALLSTFRFAFDQTPAHDRLWVFNDLDVVGALVNLPRQHWMALRCLSGEVWLLDSLAAGPRHIGPWDGPAVAEFARAHPLIFPVRRLGPPPPETPLLAGPRSSTLGHASPPTPAAAVGGGGAPQRRQTTPVPPDSCTRTGRAAGGVGGGGAPPAQANHPCASRQCRPHR